MTGPEHYREAERLTEHALKNSGPSDAGVVLAAAQVHATLALAAATAMDARGAGGMGPVDFGQWRFACGGDRA